ncbi:MAG: aspartate aminotransferase family protein [Terrimicrobiaceae bacterium]|nr:aspartate aminotransferase family protein [Terrimicrobiaceae bacterium]
MNPDLRALYDRYVMPTYGRFDLTIERGAGCRVWTDEGRELIDFGAGIAVCSLGHAHPRVTQAVSEQAAKLVHTSNLYRTSPQALLAERIVRLIGLDGKIFFCNSGAEANEGLIKLARKFGSATGRFEILTLRNSFHGRTMAGISATGQDKVKAGFAPLLEGFTHVPANDLAAVRAAIGEQTVAILIEPIQGESGIHLATPEFLRGVRELCDTHGLLLFFDEIQCGLGRTGDWRGWKSIAPYGVEPDGVSWAKGIANGFPLGAFWARNRALDDRGPLCDLLGPGTHGTTFGGNPVVCAAGLAVLDEIEEKGLLAHANETGAYFAGQLRALGSPLVAEVRALGLMVGLEVVGDLNERLGLADTRTPALALTARLMDAGLLVIPAGERTIRFLPPLNVARADIDAAVRILRDILAEEAPGGGRALPAAIETLTNAG